MAAFPSLPVPRIGAKLPAGKGRDLPTSRSADLFCPAHCRGAHAWRSVDAMVPAPRTRPRKDPEGMGSFSIASDSFSRKGPLGVALPLANTPAGARWGRVQGLRNGGRVSAESDAPGRGQSVCLPCQPADPVRVFSCREGAPGTHTPWLGAGPDPSPEPLRVGCPQRLPLLRSPASDSKAWPVSSGRVGNGTWTADPSLFQVSLGHDNQTCTTTSLCISDTHSQDRVLGICHFLKKLFCLSCCSRWPQAMPGETG